MANTKSARKATRVIARRTEVNKGRRSALRNSVRTVEEAIKSGDRKAALAAFKAAEPAIMKPQKSRSLSRPRVPKPPGDWRPRWMHHAVRRRNFHKQRSHCKVGWSSYCRITARWKSRIDIVRC